MVRTVQQGWFMVALAGALLGGWLQPTVAEGAISVVWTGPNDGDGDFNDLVISFAPFVASELSLIDGDAYSHNQGFLDLQYGIEVRVDSAWVEIDSWNHADSNHHLLSERTQGGPLSFVQGMVDGLKLKNLYKVTFGYHDLTGTEFIFDTPDESPPPVPEPASLLIWGSGAVGLALMRRRHKHRGRKQRNHSATA